MHIIRRASEATGDLDQIYGDDNAKSEVSKFDKVAGFHAKHTLGSFVFNFPIFQRHIQFNF